MLVHPAFSTVLRNNRPTVEVFDVRDSTSALTTYTFSSANLPPLGGVYSTGGDVYGTNPHVKSPNRKMIVVTVHAEDALGTYTVDSVTLGGVSGTEASDRGGTAVTTAASYYWDASSLADITNSDVVVTFSEAISSCAVGILILNNVGIVASTGSTTSQVSVTPNLEAADMNMVLISSATSATGSGGASVSFTIIGAAGNYQPQWLYEGSNSVMSWAAAWSLYPGYNGGQRIEINPQWSAGAEGLSVACFY